MRFNLLVAVLVAALIVPLAAFADGTTPNPSNVASTMCSQLKTSMGAATFGATYGTNASKSNAFGKCVSKQAHTAQADVSNASQACAAERAKDPAAFATKYGASTKQGSNGANRNAFGKCVSSLVKQSTTTQTQSIVKAAKSCKAALKASTTDFAATYGSKPNAFGKCVSALSKTK